MFYALFLLSFYCHFVVILFDFLSVPMLLFFYLPNLKTDKQYNVFNIYKCKSDGAIYYLLKNKFFASDLKITHQPVQCTAQ